MRLFFGVKPDPASALEIEAWREHHLPPMRSPVPAYNLHMTLVFLGEVQEPQLESLATGVDAIRAASVSVRLDELGYFPRPRVLWIGPSETPTGLLDIVHQLSSAARRQGLRLEKRKFQAHLTIARRCEFAPPASTQPPEFQLDFDNFSLLESTNTRAGVIYRSIASWPLHSDH